MKKLEPKDIACNLPYKLTCLVGGEPDSDSETITGLSHDCHGWWADFEDKDSVMLDGIMPILRPMSDITKPIEVNGEKITPIAKILETFNFDGYYGFYTSFKEADDIEVYIWDDHICNLRYNLGIYSASKNHNIAISFDMWQQVNDLLNQWHFDYRGLIEQGLAIDINTVK